jgi:hypothetical protein
MKTLINGTILSIILTFALFAQTGDVTKEPGYIDFGSFTEFEKSTGVTEIILEEDLLSALAQISDDEDPNIMSVLEGLKLVKAFVFEVDDKNRDKLLSKINTIDSKLSGTDWKRIVKTRKENEAANVYIKLNGKKQIIGLAVTSLESDGEAAFVNIVGTIDLATIGKLGKQFNIPHLEGIKHHKGEKDEN